MVDSTDLLSEVIADIEFPIPADDFTVYDLARLTADYETPLFKDEEFRLLLEQGIRLHVDSSVELRARLVERLRDATPEMDAAARKITLDVISGVEDIEFPLYRIGAVVSSYTNQLFQKLEGMPDSSEAEDEARRLLEEWRGGRLGRQTMMEELREIGPGAVAPAADLLFESPDDRAVADAALELLSTLESNTSARILAYLVSEPVLEEEQEERAQQTLAEIWPTPLPYILYNLKKHSHEDLPYRWFELLVATGYTRAADRILEEVAVHSGLERFREDLLSILSLLEASKDPGVVGKILRLMTDARTTEPTVLILENWLEESSMAEEVEAGMDRWNDGRSILVARDEDFNALVSRQPERGFDELRRDWNDAFHESLGWQRRKQFKRGALEAEFEEQLQETMMRELSLNPRHDEAELQAQIESFREDWLMRPRDGVIPLVAIYLERPRENPWLEEIYWCEINGWYAKAAQFFDQGIRSKARQYLDIVLQIESEYPLARTLDKALGHE